jgi:23S rRNA pseudouridine1911/1915/1917 synthase
MGDPFLAEEVPDALDGERLDRLVSLLTGCSRAEATEAVRAGAVRVGGRPLTKGSHRVAAGDRVEVQEEPRHPPGPPEADVAVEVPVVHVDRPVIVVDKPAGLVVHPAHGHGDGTLVNGLLARFPELAEVGDPLRPGVVHRLDRGTSGLMVVARTPQAMEELRRQLDAHTVQRTYTALVWRHLEHPHGAIDAPVGRSRRDPLRMAVAEDGKPALTRYRVERRFEHPVEVDLLTCELETGRTHQIRVHLGSIGHPVVGDGLYGGRRQSLALERPFLHARRLSFVHPGTGEEVVFESPLPADLDALLRGLA